MAAPIPSRFYLDPKIWYFVFLWTTNSILVSVNFLYYQRVLQPLPVLFEATSKDDFKDTISQIQETGGRNANSFVTIQSVIKITLKQSKLAKVSTEKECHLFFSSMSIIG